MSTTKHNWLIAKKSWESSFSKLCYLASIATIALPVIGFFFPSAKDWLNVFNWYLPAIFFPILFICGIWAAPYKVFSDASEEWGKEKARLEAEIAALSHSTMRQATVGDVYEHLMDIVKRGREIAEASGDWKSWFDNATEYISKAMRKRFRDRFVEASQSKRSPDKTIESKKNLSACLDWLTSNGSALTIEHINPDFRIESRPQA